MVPSTSMWFPFLNWLVEITPTQATRAQLSDARCLVDLQPHAVAQTVGEVLGVAGGGDDVAGGGNKPATLETGATIQVPLFVNIGDRVKVQTATGEYMSRA